MASMHIAYSNKGRTLSIPIPVNCPDSLNGTVITLPQKCLLQIFYNARKIQI